MNNEINETVSITVDEKAKGQVSEAEKLSTTVKSLTIGTPQEQINSSEYLQRVKDMIKVIDETRKEITKPLVELKKSVKAFFDPALDELELAKTIVSKALLDYDTEQQRIHREAEQQAFLAARAKEEKKQKALEARAEKAEEKGNPIKAEILRHQSENIYVAPVVSVAAPTKVQGMHIQQKWKFSVEDIKKVPREYLVINEPMLSKLATAMQDKVHIHGIKFYKVGSVVNRGTSNV